MKNKWNKILLELSYRVSTGIPDLSNEQHLMKLWDILKEHNWNLDARVELLKNLDEAVKKRYYQTDKGQSAPKGAKVGVGPDRVELTIGLIQITHRPMKKIFQKKNHKMNHKKNQKQKHKMMKTHQSKTDKKILS